MIVLSSKKIILTYFQKLVIAFTYDPKKFTEKNLRENFFPTRNAVDRF